MSNEAAALLMGQVESFSPDDVSGLTMWYDAQDGTELTVDGSNRITDWADKASGGYDLAQATEANMPTYDSTAFGNRGAALFNGTSQFMTGSCSEMQGTKVYSLFAAVRNDPYTNNSYVFNDGLGYGAFRVNGRELRSNLSATTTWYYSANTELPAADTDTVVGCRYDTAQATEADRLTFYHDGDEVTPSVYPALDAAWGGSNSTVVLGRLRTTGPAFMEGYIGEVLIYEAAVSDSDASSIQTYLMNRWGVS